MVSEEQKVYITKYWYDTQENKLKTQTFELQKLLKKSDYLKHLLKREVNM